MRIITNRSDVIEIDPVPQIPSTLHIYKAPELLRITPNEVASLPKDLIWELKYDGECLLIDTSRNKMVNRRGRDVTHRYPELYVQLKNSYGIICGEVVIGEGKKEDFQKIQPRLNLNNKLKIELLSKQNPVRFIAFDILEFNGEPLINKTFIERRAILKGSLIQTEQITISKQYSNFEEAWQYAIREGYEGVVGKRPGRWASSGAGWKVKTKDTADCIVCGWRPGEGSRTNGVGSLVLGQYQDDKLIYVGCVGTGFDTKTLITLKKVLSEIPSECRVQGCDDKDINWVKPVIVVEVQYLNRSKEGRLRQPSFIRFRFDKKPSECKIKD